MMLLGKYILGLDKAHVDIVHFHTREHYKTKCKKRNKEIALRKT